MEQFIQTVKKYPCLWNTTAIEYRDQELKDAAWAEVMKETDLGSVKDVKLKWKKLRDSYRDALKRQSDMLARDPAAGGAGSKKTYSWKYMDLMHFLQPHMNARKKLAEQEQPRPPSRSNTRSSEASDSEDEPAAAKRPKYERQNGQPLPSLTPQQPPLDLLYREHARRQLEAYAAPRRDIPDPLDVFFNSMCQTTKRLPYGTQIKIKKVLFSAVVEAEEALLAEQASYASLWAREASSSGSEAADGNDDDDRKS